MKQLGKNVPDQTHILFGVAVDTKLGESVSVTLISSLGLNQLNTVAAAAPPAEMLPLKERAMPSVLNTVAAKPPAPVKQAPVEEAMDMLFKTEEITAPAPVETPADETEQVEMFESQTVIDEVVLEEPEAELPVIEDEIQIEIEEEVQEEPVAYIPEPEPQPVKPVVRPRIEDFIPTITRTTTSLASVVSRTPAPLDESAYAPPLNMAPAKKPSAQDEQIAFRFGSEEDRGRFKDTEPAIAGGGEDLDVPTWMRLKRKLKR
jgi:hypothetical protein